MTRSSTFKASLLALCAGASFLPFAAQAAFNPSGWNVKQAPFAAAGGGQTCTIVTHFDNGFSLQMTGSADGVQNLSIDVRQPAFQAGGIMDTTLSVPGITSQQVQGQAYGNNLLVIDMNGQKNLLAAMRKGNVLNVNVAGNDLSFNLTGLNDATGHFDQCVGGTDVFGSDPVTDASMAAPPPVVEAAPMTAQPAPASAPVSSKPAPVAPRASAPMNVASTDHIAAPAPHAPMIAGGQGVSMPPPDVDDDYNAPADESGYASAAPAVKAQPPAAPQGNLVAHKTPELAAPEPQPDAQDMERMEKQELAGKDFDADDEFKTVPVKEIVPPPPALKMAEESASTPVPSVPPAVKQVPAPAPIPAPVTQTPATSAPLPVANPISNPPQSGRYVPPQAQPTTSKGAYTEQAVVPAAAPQQAPAVKPEDDIAWNAIPSSDKDLPAGVTPTPRPVPPAPKAPAPALKSKVVDMPDGSQKITSPDAPITREVHSANVDLTKVGLPDDQAAAPVTSHDTGASGTRIAEMQKTIDLLRAQNATLDEDLKASLNESKTETASVSSENWNLEQAAMRYNEAERQIQRLGEQLHQERASCAQDKKDIEGQLFDPALTDQKQIAKLNDLQSQLDAAQSELANQRRTYEARIQALQSQLGKK